MVSFAIVTAYLIVTLAVTFYLSKVKKKSGATTKELFVANGNLAALFIVPLLFGEMMSNGTTVGTAGSAYSGGLAGAWGLWGSALGTFVFVAFFLKFYDKVRVTGAITPPEAYKERFDGRVRMVFLLVSMISIIVLLATYVAAISALLAPMVDVEPLVMSCFAALFFFLMGVMGIKGIAGMNVVHSLVMIVGLVVVAFACVGDIGGLPVLLAETPPEFWNPFNGGILNTIAGAIGSILAFATAVAPVNLVYSGREISSVRRGICFAGLLMIAFSVLPILIGMTGAVKFDDISRPDSILYLMPASIDPVLSGIATMAVCAAAFSTGPFFLLNVATLFVRNIYNCHLRPGSADKEQLKVTYTTMAIVALAIVALSNGVGSILGTILGILQCKSIAAILLLFGIYWKRLDNNAAFWGYLFGSVVSVVWFFLGSPFGVAPLWPGLVVSIVIWVVGSLVAVPKETSDWQAFENRMIELGKKQE